MSIFVDQRSLRPTRLLQTLAIREKARGFNKYCQSNAFSSKTFNTYVTIRYHYLVSLYQLIYVQSVLDYSGWLTYLFPQKKDARIDFNQP